MSELAAAGSPVDDLATKPPSGGASSRADGLPGPARAVHRAVLRHFVASGGPPSASQLESCASVAEIDLHEALALLRQHDLVHQAASGDIEVAYPFSGRPTDHQVSLPDGTRVFAMCALDALGIPLMIDSDATVDSVDPQTRRHVTVRRRGQEWSWQPDSAVVLLAWTDGTCARAFGLCQSTNFHADAEAAERWLASAPTVTGMALDHDTAVALAARSFATLLR
jgi:alkylmercury lyase